MQKNVRVFILSHLAILYEGVKPFQIIQSKLPTNSVKNYPFSFLILSPKEICITLFLLSFLNYNSFTGENCVFFLGWQVRRKIDPRGVRVSDIGRFSLLNWPYLCGKPSRRLNKNIISEDEDVADTYNRVIAPRYVILSKIFPIMPAAIINSNAARWLVPRTYLPHGC